MLHHQFFTRPASLKDCRVHRSSGDFFSLRPNLMGVDSLQGLVWTQHQSAHIPADVLKAFFTTKYLAVILHSGDDSRRHSDHWKHWIGSFFPRSVGASTGYLPPSVVNLPSRVIRWLRRS